MLNVQAVIEILGKVLTNERTKAFIECPSFWPIAVKGGFECTLRDYVLADLQRELTARFPGNNYICPGERGWGRRGLRADILFCDSTEIDKNGRLVKPPLAEVELKINFGGQVDRIVAKNKKEFPTRSVATLKKIIKASKENSSEKKISMAFVAVQFIHQLYDCDPTDTKLARRYSQYRDHNEDATKDRFAQLITRKIKEIGKQKFDTKKIAEYPLRGDRKGTGEMVALASWKKRS